MGYQELFLFLLGLAVGSFLNVVALRYKPGAWIFTKDIFWGRSHCPKCQQNLRWYELVPILSFFIQLGRCRHCHQLITWQYPIVELISGLVFVSVPLYLSSPFIWIMAILTLTLIALIDYRLSIIPDQLNWFLAFLGLAFFGLNSIWGFLFGAGIFALIIFTYYQLTKVHGMGFGDLKLAAALGFLFGWPKIVLIVALAFVIGGLWAAVLLLAKRKAVRDSLPLGPFLVIAAILIMFIGDNLIRFYSLYLL